MVFPVKKKHFLILSVIFTIFFLIFTGCTEISNPSLTGNQLNQITVTTFNNTPVQYARDTGVALGYREFESGEPVLVITGQSTILL